MAVLALKSIQQTEGVRKYPLDDHGKVRHQYFEIAPVVSAGDIGTTIDLCELPPGRIRILPYGSRFMSSAWGAARTLSIGLRAYTARDQDQGIVIAESATELVNASTGVVAGGITVFDATKLKYDLYAKQEIMVFATVGGGTIPVGATLSGFISYLYE